MGWVVEESLRSGVAGHCRMRTEITGPRLQLRHRKRGCGLKSFRVVDSESRTSVVMGREPKSLSVRKAAIQTLAGQVAGRVVGRQTGIAHPSHKREPK